MSEFSKGDIVCNKYAGANNPCRYLMYLGKSTIRQGRYKSKGYDCLSYAGKKVQLFREHDPIVFVGHMAEYDAFIKALESLRDYKEAE